MCRLAALRPAVAGMIGAAALVLIFGISWTGGGLSMHILQDNFPDWKAWALFAASFLLCYTKKTGPITLLVASGVLGLLIY